MDKKEEIIIAALDLASEKGLGNVSMAQIAEKAGIRKASLYNHFDSKEEMISQMYVYLRENAKNQLSPGDIDISALVRDKSAYEVLMLAVNNYVKLNSNERMQKFYRFIYSQRPIDPVAARIITEETNKMIAATKSLFYALAAHRKISDDNIDTAAVSFAMTIHSMLDHKLDCRSCGEKFDSTMIQDYIHWLCKQLGGQ